MREFVSFGAGVQTTALAVLAMNRDERLLKVTGGKVPERYIFADTGDEPADVYAQLGRITDALEKHGFPLDVCHRYGGTPLSERLLTPLEAGKESNLTWTPMWVWGQGRASPLQRRCTFNMKVEALTRAARRLAEVPRGYKGDPFVRTWLGISLDEMQRMKVSQERWQTFFYPLIEMGWRRDPGPTCTGPWFRWTKCSSTGRWTYLAAWTTSAPGCAACKDRSTPGAAGTPGLNARHTPCYARTHAHMPARA